MKQNYTDITFILDRSGSMQSIKDDTIGGFNEFLDSQKKLPGECTLSLVQFDDKYEVVYENKPISKAPKLKLEPHGMTALLDAVGRTINNVGERLSALDEDKRPDSVLMVIITDGQENSSREFNNQQIKDMIEHQTNVYNWTFVYIGANQDAFNTGTSMGIAGANTMTYAANAVGTRAFYSSISRNIGDFRDSGGKTAIITDEDREKQKLAGVN